MSTFDEFKVKFKIEEFLIYDTEFWIWSLRPHQATLGSSILSLKREAIEFSNLNEEEFKDLGNIIRVIESTLKAAFGYDVINHLMLMMFDRYVHFHIIPRYKKANAFNSIEWIDVSWPGIPPLIGQEIDSEEGLFIIKEIKKMMAGKEVNNEKV